MYRLFLTVIEIKM